jgi:hypothetical protein
LTTHHLDVLIPHLRGTEIDTGGTIVIGDDIFVAEKNLGYELLNSDENKLTLDHFIGEKVPDVTVYDIKVGCFGEVFIGKFLGPGGQNLDELQVFYD